MQECIDVLENSPEAIPSDRLLTQYVRIQYVSDGTWAANQLLTIDCRKICEEISVAFFMDDASATTISITDPKVSYTLDIYEQKLKDWEAKLPIELSQPSMSQLKQQLMFFRDVTELYLHEIAMQ